MDGECFLKENVVHGADTPDSCPTIKSHGQQLAPAFLSKPGAHVSFYKLPEIVPFQTRQALFRSVYTQKSSWGCLTKRDPSHYHRKDSPSHLLRYSGREALVGRGALWRVRDRHTIQAELMWEVLLGREWGKERKRERQTEIEQREI